MAKPKAPRMVRTLEPVYYQHIYRRAGAEFLYDGPPNSQLFLELGDPESSPVESNVPRKRRKKTEGSVSDLL